MYLEDFDQDKLFTFEVWTILKLIFMNDNIEYEKFTQEIYNEILKNL